MSSQVTPFISIAWMMKRHAGTTYLFAVNMRNQPTRGACAVRELSPRATAEVLGESRNLPITNGEFADEFAGYAVHLYRLDAPK